MNANRIKILFIFLSISILSFGQDAPKLVVGVVIDQFRYDLIQRFKHNFSENGFKRLMREGFFAENMHYNYMPTYTGPGHASVYTGSVPAVHGIVANDWIQKHQKMYCVQDDASKTLGAQDDNGQMSPKNLLVTTVTDELRISNNLQSKVVSIALKDRGAILPGGHLANEAYWYNPSVGKWISSDYYAKELPKWILDFNQKNYPQDLMKSGWNLLYPKSKYMYQNSDSSQWEDIIDGKGTTFPHVFKPEDYGQKIGKTPYGNDLTNLLAIAALDNTNLGKGSQTDFLAISYSSTDYVGHSFGPNSLEIEDCYYRMDKTLAELLDALDKRFGKSNYWLFVTGDHGVQMIPGLAESMKLPAGALSEKKIKEEANKYISAKLKLTDPIDAIENHQFYIKDEYKDQVSDIAEYLNRLPYLDSFGIRGIYAFEEIAEASLPTSIQNIVTMGYYPRRSGDIAIIVEPGWMSFGKRGTTHGSPYSHDTHIPFLFFGKGVTHKSSPHRYFITDIAPTISYLLGIIQPSGCIGNPIEELNYLKNK